MRSGRSQAGVQQAGYAGFKNRTIRYTAIFGVIVGVLGIVEVGADHNSTAKALRVTIGCRELGESAECQMHAGCAAAQLQAAQAAAEARLNLRRTQQAEEGSARIGVGEHGFGANLLAAFQPSPAAAAALR